MCSNNNNEKANKDSNAAQIHHIWIQNQNQIYIYMFIYVCMVCSCVATPLGTDSPQVIANEI